MNFACEPMNRNNCSNMNGKKDGKRLIRLLEPVRINQDYLVIRSICDFLQAFSEQGCVQAGK